MLHFASVPLHSHGGQEYILVLSGSFCDEYANYNKGDMQINDQKIKHTPIACKDEGCICLTITEKDLTIQKHPIVEHTTQDLLCFLLLFSK